MVKNRKCLSCQTSYSYCPNCNGPDKFAPSWKAEFCSETCKDLWMVLTKFGMSMITKSEAREIISSLDLKPIDFYVECVKRDYAKVMVEDKKPKRGKRIEIKPIDDAVEIEMENHIVEVLEQPVVAELVAIEPEHEVVIENE